MTVVTRCQILRLKCTSAPPDPLAGFKGPTFKRREGKRGSREERGGERKGKKKGREGGTCSKVLGGDRRPWLYS